jgi:hypothetical protein
MPAVARRTRGKVEPIADLAQAATPGARSLAARDALAVFERMYNA